MSRFFGNITRMFIGQKVSLFISNGSLYSCGAILGTQMKVGKVLQPYDAVDLGGFGDSAYILTADSLLKVDSL